jgi:protein-tyrosine phosphatase
MTSHPYDALPLADGGKLLLTPCPGTQGVDLADAIEQLRQAGAAAVVSMTPRGELEKLGVSALPEAVANGGMRWFQFPIEDDAAPGPAFEQAWAAERDALLAMVSRHNGIAIHCRGGSGRTGFMAALLLRELGLDAEQADAEVRRLRPNALKLPAHIDYLAARDGQHIQQELPE